MKNKNLGIFLKFCSVVCAMLMFASVISVSAAKISPGLDVIAKQGETAKSGLVYSDIHFTASDFEKSLGLSKITSITIRTLPDKSEGELKLGNASVSVNQTISRSNIKNMHFVPASSEISESKFTFSSNGSEYSTVCNLYVLSKVNFAPVTKLSNKENLSVQTQKGISFFGTLKAVDPENDEMVYEIVTGAKKGSVTILNASTGDYKYTPNANYTGKDSFSYRVHDKYGNYSDITTVKVQVKKSSSSVVYTDMKDHWAHNAAITVCANNIMSGKVIGAENYFFPNEEVSKCDFLVMVMKAVGIKDVPSCDATIFTDDSDIPKESKGYVATALNLGYVHGSYTANGILFNPNNKITRAEAAVIINNIINAEEPNILPVFADINTVPAWSQSAFYALNALGIFNGTGGGNISPYQTITRAQAAQILCSILSMK